MVCYPFFKPNYPISHHAQDELYVHIILVHKNLLSDPIDFAQEIKLKK